MKRNMLFRVPSILTLSVLAGLFAGCSKDESNPTSAPPTPESFESGTLVGGTTFVHTFNTVGSFGYRCRIHLGMTGTVQVAAAGSDSAVITIGGANIFPGPNVGSFPIKTGGYVRWINNGVNHTVTRP